MSTENNLSIFNIGEKSAEMNQAMFQEKFTSNLFDPKLKDASDSKTFIIRLVPYAKDILNSLIHKFYYVLEDGAGTMVIDSKTTFNRPAENKFEFCPMSDLWLKLKNSKDPNVQNRQASLRRQTANYAYVQIVNFPADPTLNGQFKPMRLPMELIKLIDAMANPSNDDIKLGTVPVQPFDIMAGKNIKCTITGKMVAGTLMRDWKVEALASSELMLPLGANGAMTPVSKLKQEDVIAYFNEAQTEDLNERYGFREPTDDIKVRVRQYMETLILDIPALIPVVRGYWPELALTLPNNASANGASIFGQNAGQPIAAGQPLGQPIAAGQPLGQPLGQQTGQSEAAAANGPMLP